ncbi:ABC transporter ATP-binding protein [Micromonospora sp. C51]|uniref:ABC transporter ATP-binding protein n=1 Tax=Micromonospora sp. C51 TaxID=2824879 RepID=UPI001B38CEEF|nr:ABC transporter ATP-binding protein [Micromonospora sp. C51]MBQ1050238.1 ABC transporter ATP-binding protein [Micromonospora sp. C51]
MLSLTGVCRVYDDAQPVHALRDVSLHVEQGEYVTITGASGSGKSTLLNVLGLLDLPSSGSYAVAGTETVGLGDSARGALRGQLFGFVFQAFHLLAGRSALENVELGMLYGPWPPRDRQRRAARALSRIGLARRAHADPRQLSGGERQRVAIARAVAGGPRVLFCDEPTGNLDSENTANVLELLADLHADGLTLVMVTHDQRVAASGTRWLAVEDGVVSER